PSRSWLGLVLLGKQIDRRLLLWLSRSRYSGMNRHLARQVPDEATQFTGDCHAYLGQLHLATEVELAEALREAQLGLPGNVSDELRLSLLAYLQLASDVGRVAIGPGRLDQDAPRVAVTRTRNGALAASVAARVLRGHQPQI